jgi:hypothetical protein
LLLPVEEACDEEHQREHEGELGVRQRVDAKLDNAVRKPNRTSDKPDPGCLFHGLQIGRTGWRAGFYCDFGPFAMAMGCAARAA